MIKEWIDQYKPQNSLQADQALREILQEIALAGLAVVASSKSGVLWRNRSPDLSRASGFFRRSRLFLAGAGSGF